MENSERRHTEWIQSTINIVITHKIQFCKKLEYYVLILTSEACPAPRCSIAAPTLKLIRANQHQGPDNHIFFSAHEAGP